MQDGQNLQIIILELIKSLIIFNDFFDFGVVLFLFGQIEGSFIEVQGLIKFLLFEKFVAFFFIFIHAGNYLFEGRKIQIIFFRFRLPIDTVFVKGVLGFYFLVQYRKGAFVAMMPHMVDLANLFKHFARSAKI